MCILQQRAAENQASRQFFLNFVSKLKDSFESAQKIAKVFGFINARQQTISSGGTRAEEICIFGGSVRGRRDSFPPRLQEEEKQRIHQRHARECARGRQSDVAQSLISSKTLA